jgi:hypothetical protein
VFPYMLEFCQEKGLAPRDHAKAHGADKIRIQLALMGDPLQQVYARCEMLEQRAVPRLRFALQSKPRMVAHRAYELFQTLTEYLQAIVPTESNKLTANSFGDMLASLWKSGTVARGTVDATVKQYSAAYVKSRDIATKYMSSKAGVYAGHARVLDPNRRLGMSRVIGDYASTFGTVCVRDPVV